MIPGKTTLHVGGVLFDMDGVLVSSIAGVERSWRQWAAEFGLPDAGQLVIPHGTRAIDIIRSLKPDLDPQQGLKRIEDIEVADTGDTRVLPGVQQLLASLPAQRWAIVTSATRRLLLARLGAGQLPVPSLFISGEMVERGKPDPEPYRRGAELVQLPPADCLVVEDAPSGIRSAVAAGCRVLGVLGTHTAPELRNAGATWIVPTLEHVAVTALDNGLALTLAQTEA